jgi:hypothetical protein
MATMRLARATWPGRAVMHRREITPVIGLFGSIVGYLLGRGDRDVARATRKELDAGGPEA